MRKKIILILVVFLLLGVGVLTFFILVPFSEGSRAGTLLKLSKKGVVFKTWEGELNSYMFVGDQSAASASNANLFIFSVEKDEAEVLKILEETMLNGSRVQLHYRERYFKFPWNGDTKYFIYKAEVLTNKK